MEAELLSSGALVITNTSGRTLEYSGNILGWPRRPQGDFSIAVRRADGKPAPQCGVFDSFKPIRNLQLLPGQSTRFELYAGQIADLYCVAPCEHATLVVSYGELPSLGAAGPTSGTTRFSSRSIPLVAHLRERGMRNPFVDKSN